VVSFSFAYDNYLEHYGQLFIIIRKTEHILTHPKNEYIIEKNLEISKSF
jgi:hypothetical protein